jgi:hypothetical protein
MEIKSQRFLRPLRSLWNRAGSARIYIVAAAALLLVLAAIGLTHLVSSTPATAAKTKSEPPAKTMAAKPPGTSPLSREPLIAITEIGSTETRERNGQLNVAVRIGVAPRPNAKKGEVEIRVSFFDVTSTGEMRPTDAQVDYQWMTPVRDWTDPTPKYLVATYLGGTTSRKPADNVHYGGFLVRVYFDGELQAEQSEPKALVAALRGQRPAPSTAPVSTSANPANISVTTPSPFMRQSTTVSHAPADDRTAAVNQVLPSPSQLPVNRNNSLSVPYASPVPDKPGFVYSPDNPKFLIDVRGFPPGTEVKDPNTGKLLKVP